MTDKMDFKKTEKEFYAPKVRPSVIDIPTMRFIAISGTGCQNGDSYKDAVRTLRSVAYAVKMSKKLGHPEGYYEYVTPPLEYMSDYKAEGSDCDGVECNWVLAIRQPDFVTDDLVEWAREGCFERRSDGCALKVRLVNYTDGRCVQAMHIGPCADKKRTIDAISAFMRDNDLVPDLEKRRYHEIMISDSQQISNESKSKTVIRIPVTER